MTAPSQTMTDDAGVQWLVPMAHALRIVSSVESPDRDSIILTVERENGERLTITGTANQRSSTS